jgi:hypothetical protein
MVDRVTAEIRDDSSDRKARIVADELSYCNQGFWQRIGKDLRNFAMESSYVGRIYAEELRDDFASILPQPEYKTDFEQLALEFRERAATPRPKLADMLRIEVALTRFMSDDSLRARFWIIKDRFDRVVPTKTRGNAPDLLAHITNAGNYAGRSGKRPATGNVQSDNANGPASDHDHDHDIRRLREDALALLDVIHANYLMNLGREKSLKRLKFILAFYVFGVTALGMVLSQAWNSALGDGLIFLFMAGVFGSVLSVIQRMQKAVRHDAMAEDPVYELTALRVGWVGIIWSVFMGGSFAIVLYCVVLGGLLDVASPSLTGWREGSDVSSAPIDGGLADTANTAAMAAEEAAASELPSAPPSDQSGASRPGTRIGPVPQGLPGTRIARALGFPDESNFFKMLLLAFLAGFAERFAPDILGRLSKKHSEG